MNLYLLRCIAKAMRVGHGRKCVETNLKEKLSDRNHLLDDFFEIRTLEMKQKVKKGVKLADGEVLDDKGRKLY